MRPFELLILTLINFRVDAPDILRIIKIMNYRGKFVLHSDNLSQYFKSGKFGMVRRIGLYYFVCEWLSVTTCFSDKRTYTCMHGTRKRKYAVARRVKVSGLAVFRPLRRTAQAEFRINKWMPPPFVFVFRTDFRSLQSKVFSISFKTFSKQLLHIITS